MWSGIARVVFSVSQDMLQQLSGGRPKAGCHSIINSGRRHVDIVGPLLPHEGLSVFAGFTFTPKVHRHARHTTNLHDAPGDATI